MSFLDQKPFELTEKLFKARWGTRRKDGRLQCNLCGYLFEVGETARFVYANGSEGNGSGNFFTCVTCDGPDVLDRGKALFEEARRLAKNWGIYGPDWRE